MAAGNRFIALLRGVNVGGHRKLLMSDVQALCAQLEWKNVRTYVQSGNVVFSASAMAHVLEDRLDAAIAERCGWDTPVIVRSADEWHRYATANPFPEACRSEPNRVMLALAKAAPAEGAA
jgi:uncharacterized protein (DUF1697 family)